MVRFNSSTPYNSELAEVICAIIAFDENEFGIAGQRKGSPAISSAANRLLRIREHSDSSSPVSKPSQVEQFMFTPDKSLLLEFCSIPLDGSAQAKVEEIESRLAEGFADKDLVKLHAVLSAHYFVVRDKSNLMRHLARLRNTAAWTNWADWAEKEIISDGK
jgi:hypothetical protein